MSQCVPDWELDDAPPNLSLQQHPEQHHHRQPPSSAAPLVTLTDYEVAELTWEKGQLSLQGLAHHHRVGKPMPKHPAAASSAAAASAAIHATWSKHQPSGGTLEAVVNQATGAAKLFAGAVPPTPADVGEWLGVPHRTPTSGPAAAAAMDALVPCRDDVSGGGGGGRKRPRGCGVCSSQGSAAPLARAQRAESTLVTLDSCGVTDDYGLTTTTATNSASPDEFGDGSPETENTSFGYDSLCDSRRSQPQRDGACDDEAKASKKGRAAAIHNQSERKRRDRINQKMKTLQKLVPNSSKTDKSSILDEVIDYMKQLQAQVQMMSRMSSMMLPMPTVPQLQMSMMANMAQMAQMAQVAGMGMLDAGSVACPPAAFNPIAAPLLHPSAFLSPLNPPAAATWDGGYGDQQRQPGSTLFPDPRSVFLACQNAQQPMGLDAYNRMATLFQQMYQPPPPPQQQQQPAANPKT